MKENIFTTEKEKAVQILSKMNSQLNSLNEILKNANSLFKDIDKQDKNYRKLNDTLQTINDTTKKAISIFNANKKKIATKLSEAENFYDKKYIPLINKINHPQSGLSARLKETEKDYISYKKIRADCEVKCKEIATLVKDCETKSKELAKIEAVIKAFYKSSEASSKKIKDLEIEAKVTHSKIKQIHQELLSLEINSKKSGVNITGYEKHSKDLNQKIIDYHKVSQEKLEDIQKVYEIAHETGLSGEFEKRRNDLYKEINNWKWWIFGASLLLLVGIIILFIWQYQANGNKFDEIFDFNFYVRFLIFSPIVYYLYFVSSQYNKAKKLHDKYAFKTTLSMTIKSHIELLTRNDYFNKAKENDKILDFILDGFRIIYNEPYVFDNYKMKIKLANFEIDLQRKMIDKLSEITGSETKGNLIQATVETNSNK
jgi:hypothetical protein